MSSRKIVVAVTGGIAAYKACDLVSQLTKQDDEVRVIMTKHATQFVSPLTFETLTHHKVETSLFDDDNEDVIAHINLAKWADLMVMVPASANALAKLANGIADDLVSTTFLAATCPKLVCPAMNVHMYEAKSTTRNLHQLQQDGYHVLEPAVGHLACDDTGKGKLPSIADLLHFINQFPKPQRLVGKTVLVTAGPTQEKLDPVRFISNHSTGKQGVAIAQAAKDLGAHVILIHGPIELDTTGFESIAITTANELMSAIQAHYQRADYIIMAAAVSDYRFETVLDQKLKKKEDSLTLTMVKNPDCLAWLGQHKLAHQVLCGFAMETQNLDDQAKEKCLSKHCDILVGNLLTTPGAGFKVNTNVATFYTPTNTKALPQLSKYELGLALLEEMEKIDASRH